MDDPETGFITIEKKKKKNCRNYVKFQKWNKIFQVRTYRDNRIVRETNYNPYYIQSPMEIIRIKFLPSYINENNIQMRVVAKDLKDQKYILDFIPENNPIENRWFTKLENKIQNMKLNIGSKFWIKGYYIKIPTSPGKHKNRFMKDAKFHIIFDNKPVC